jgi:3-keto-disaccharide hydrolase
MRRYALLLGSIALMASVTLPAAADSGRHHKATCETTTRDGYAVIYDGSKRCFERWRYAGGASITRQRDGFADLDSAHSHPVPKGVWYDLEIRVVNQHYTVIRDGQVINEFENVPGLTLGDRVNDPPSEARGLVGYVGLQSHGGPNDVVSFRNVRIMDLSDRD